MARDLDYYESPRALGELYRNITYKKPDSIPQTKFSNGAGKFKPSIDSITAALTPLYQKYLGTGLVIDAEVMEMNPLFQNYVLELRYMRFTHALSDSPESRLEEEEIVVGTILANCSQHRYRTDRTYRMRLHAATVVRTVQQALFKPEVPDTPQQGELVYGLRQAWMAWEFSRRYKHWFGAYSFGIIALGVMCNVLNTLGDITLKKGPVKDSRSSSPVEDAEEEDEPQYRERR